MLRLALFIAASCGILALSRRSLLRPRSHGFYRFFAFELLLALVLLNAPYWFRDPASPRQLLSWTLLALSLGLAFEGFRLLLIVGRPRAAAPADGPNLAFENTSQLVTTGAYRFIRHPLYASLLPGACGAFLKRPGLLPAALALAAFAFILATALAEERENLARFPAYRDYKKTTRRFIPFVF